MKLTNNEDFYFIGKDGKCDRKLFQSENIHCQIVETLGLCSDLPIDDFDLATMKKKVEMLVWMKRHQKPFEPGKQNWFVFYDYKYNVYDYNFTQFNKDVGKTYMSRKDCERFIIEFDGGIGLI